MAFPTGWSYKQKLTIDATKVNESTSGFSLVVTRDHLDDDVVDPSGSNAARVDGGDVRFSSDSAGTTQLACDVVEFEHDTSTAAGDAGIKVIVDVDMDSATDKDIYIWYKNAAATQPVPASTYGAHNAYDANHVGMYPGVFGSKQSATSLWLIGPKSVTYNGATYYVWLDSRSTLIRISKYTHSTGVWSDEQTVATPSGNDAHQSPSVMVDSSGYIWVFYGDYSNDTPSNIYYVKSTNTEDITAWGSATSVVSGTRLTYPSAVQLSGGNIVLFYRDDDGVHRIVWNGSSWVNGQQIIASTGSDRPYFQTALGSSDRVHLAYHWYDDATTTHRDLYYAYSDDADATTSAWAAADATGLSLPLGEDATQLVFNSDTSWDTGYLGGLSIGASNQPHIVFGVTHSSNTNKLLHFTYSSGWSNNDIIADNGVEVSGYAAGVIDCDINADDNSAIQCIFCIDVSGTYEIKEYSTTDGSTWASLRTVTANSARNNRLVGYTNSIDNACRAVWQYADALHYNTGFADHHFLSSNNGYVASWVDFLTKTTNFTRDRTANHNDMDAAGTPTEVAGQIGTAFNFDGSTEYFSAALTTLTDEEITLSCLFNSDDVSINQNPIGLGNNGATGHFRQMLVGSGGIRSQKQDDTGTPVAADTLNTPTNSTWHHAASIFTSDTLRTVYLDMDTGNKGSDTASEVDPTVDWFSFGALRRSSIAQHFDGSLEQVRATSSAFSENRLITEKNNLISPSTFITAGTPAAAGITGTSAAINANDVYASAGELANSGSAETTNANDSQAAAGRLALSGTAAANNANDSQAASGIVGDIISEPGRIFKASLPLRTFKAALPIRTYKAAA